MKNTSKLHLSWLLLVISLKIFATTYNNENPSFQITYDSNWEKVDTPDKTTILMLACAGPECGKNTYTSTITIGAQYTSALADGTLDQFLKQAQGNGYLITNDVRSKYFVQNFKLLSEGETSIGNVKAYEIKMQFTYINQEPRIRDTFLTFCKGNLYNLSFQCSPGGCQTDLNLAEQVIKSFEIPGSC